MRKNILIIIMVLLLVTLLGGCNAINDQNNKEENIPVEDIAKDEDIIDPIEEEPIEDEVLETVDIAVGELAPNFTLKNLDGDDVSLEDYRGKIVLLNFWATWCKWCDVEMPDLQKLDKEHDDLVVLAIDVMEDKATVEDYIDKGGYEFEVVLDEDGEIAKTYLVSGFPTSYFIDEEGILLGGVPGMMEYDQMVEILESIRENKQ